MSSLESVTVEFQLYHEMLSCAPTRIDLNMIPDHELYWYIKLQNPV